MIWLKPCLNDQSARLFFFYQELRNAWVCNHYLVQQEQPHNSVNALKHTQVPI